MSNEVQERVIRSFIYAVLTAVIGTVTVANLAPIAMEWHLVSTDGGGQALPTIILWCPAGFLIGFVIGFYNTFRDREERKLNPLIRSFLQIELVIALAMGIAWISRPPQPKLEGRSLNLQYEVRLPLSFRLREFNGKIWVPIELRPDQDSQDNSFWVPRANVESDGGFLVIHGIAPIRTFSEKRRLSINFTNPNTVIELPSYLPPSREDMSWSNWITPGNHSRASDLVFSVRYRVQTRPSWFDRILNE